LEPHTQVAVAAVVLLQNPMVVLVEQVAAVMVEAKTLVDQTLISMAVAVAVAVHANLVQAHMDMPILVLDTKASAYSVTQEVK
jgi:hypothetical protein